jgi:hypothetical protein
MKVLRNLHEGLSGGRESCRKELYCGPCADTRFFDYECSPVASSDQRISCGDGH